MALPFPPTSQSLLFELVEGGDLVAFVQVTFGRVVTLSGVPRYTFTDSLGRSHRAVSASPRVVSPPGVLVDFVHLRFIGGVTLPPPLMMHVPALDPHVTGAGGATVLPGVYAVTV